ncbi:hypothetical protein I350_06592 [Cryptococcus amylolentus CBS 6273]|uniref:Uncharacterized protein n=1 Tax=Cryptococcus amylolentus CBS 6273 TaxID=1296118 RepID=A0A1E3JLS2_9TREE|nr:hypothetical protein I350_06592 [Cryptococcus amylolentus CBS 6273]
MPSPPPSQPVHPAPQPVDSASQSVATPASGSLLPVPRWRELVAIIPTAMPSGDGGFDEVMRDLFADIAGQDQRAYDWIANEYRKIEFRQLPPEEENEARNIAKQEIDDHRAFLFGPRYLQSSM